MSKTISLACLLLVALAAPARANLPASFNWSDDAVRNLVTESTDLHEIAGASADEQARIVRILMRGGDATSALRVLESTPDLERFEALRTNDEQQDTTVRSLYDQLDATGKTKLVALTQSAGAAATASGQQQLGIISDNDDTAFPTEHMEGFHPLGYKDANKFYKLLAGGTDGKGDTKANMHYVSARPPFLFPNSHLRVAAAGLPWSTIDGDSSVKNVLDGLDGVQTSKEENIDLWLKLHPGQRFVFLGDTLQRDPEVYNWVLANHKDQVEAVLIHKAGAHGQLRPPADYKGEVFFDNYDDAMKTVESLGIPQPGAKLAPQPDLDALPLPNTDVSDIHVNAVKTVGQFALENTAAVGKVTGDAIAHGVVTGVKDLGKDLGHVIGIGKKPAADVEAPRTGASELIDSSLGNDGSH